MLDTLNPLFNEDDYKSSHFMMNPKGVTRVYSTWTCRGSRLPGIDYSIFFGLRNYLRHLVKRWEPFFASESAAKQFIQEYRFIMEHINGPGVATDQFIDLYRYGRLPITMRSVKEGTRVPIRTASMVIESTNPETAWFSQFLETDISNYIWKPITSATISVDQRMKDRLALEQSGGPMFMLDYLNHDFSYRGMSGREDAIISGMGHLVGSNGTDTIPAVVRIWELHESLAGKSVNASEHAVMCINGPEREYETVEHILNTFPDKPVSIVADTWNLWNFVQNYLSKLDLKLTDREKPLILRPDSGDPLKILMGDKEAPEGIVRQGLVPFLLEKYKHDVRYTDKGYRLLPVYLGTIYGDAMNADRCNKLNELMLAAGICPSNTVRGRGSFTYEYQTRDSLGQALKAVEADVNGETRALFKDPITDNGEKKSAKGRVGLVRDANGDVIGMRDQLGPNEPDGFDWQPMTDGRLTMGEEDFQSVRIRTKAW